MTGNIKKWFFQVLLLCVLTGCFMYYVTIRGNVGGVFLNVKRRSNGVQWTPNDGSARTGSIYKKIKTKEASIDETNVTEWSERARYKLIQTGRSDLLDTTRNCRKKLPECLIIGVMKAGTEAFCTFLAIHPQVAMALTLRSTMFFSENYNKGIHWYRDQMMCSSQDQMSIEKAPQYFPSRIAPERISSTNPNMKLILLVRNPVDRAVSHFLQDSSVNINKGRKLNYETFEDCAFRKSGYVNADCPYLVQSRYSTIVYEWLRFFPRNQMLIIDGDKFREDITGSMSNTEQFLGIRTFITKDKFHFNATTELYCLNNEYGCLSEGKGRVHPTLDPVHSAILQQYFKPYNDEFYHIAGRSFNW